MSETKTDPSENKSTSALTRIVENFRRSTSGEKVTCLNCGAVNPAGQDKCENCEEPLQKPAPLAVNFIESIIRPMRAMPRIAATAPIMQAFLVVMLMASIYIFMGAYSTLSSLDQLQPELDKFNREYPAATDNLKPEDRFIKFVYYLRADNNARADKTKFNQDFQTELDKIKPEDRLTRYNNFINSPPTPGLLFIVTTYLFLIMSWAFFAIAIFYTARIFYRNDNRGTIPSILAVVGFARVATLGALLFLLPIPNEIAYGLQIALLAWQLVLAVIGTRAATGLSWNRCAIIVVLPALLFRFFLQLPI